MSSLRKYLAGEFEPSPLLKSMRDKPIFLGKVPSYDNLTYGQAKFIFQLISDNKGVIPNEGLAEVFSYVYGVTEDEVLDASLTDVYRALNPVMAVIKSVRDLEIKMLGGGDEVKKALYKQAAGTLLDGFDYILPLIELGKTYGLYPYDISKKKFTEILVLRAAESRLSQVDKKFTELSTK